MKFDGTGKTCGLLCNGWECRIHLCPVCKPKRKCIDPDKRTDFIRALVTGPEFVPEEVQREIVDAYCASVEVAAFDMTETATERGSVLQGEDITE